MQPSHISSCFASLLQIAFWGRIPTRESWNIYSCSRSDPDSWLTLSPASPEPPRPPGCLSSLSLLTTTHSSLSLHSSYPRSIPHSHSIPLRLVFIPYPSAHSCIRLRICTVTTDCHSNPSCKIFTSITANDRCVSHEHICNSAVYQQIGVRDLKL